MKRRASRVALGIDFGGTSVKAGWVDEAGRVDRLGTACLAASLVLIQNAPALLRHVLTSPLLVHFGVLSYSVYLWQQPFATSAGMGPTCLVLAFAAALASYYLVERPGREFLNRSGARA